MILPKKNFESFFEERFCNCQGEDSPYSYDDVKAAYLQGVKDTRARLMNAIDSVKTEVPTSRLRGMKVVCDKIIKQFKKVSDLTANDVLWNVR
jgi:hypothetical protein